MRVASRCAGSVRVFVGWIELESEPLEYLRRPRTGVGDYEREITGLAGYGGDCAAFDEREHAASSGAGADCAGSTAGHGDEPDQSSTNAGAKADGAVVSARHDQGLYAAASLLSESAEAVYADDSAVAEAGEHTAAELVAARREDLSEPVGRGGAGAGEQLRYRDCADQPGHCGHGYTAGEGGLRAARRFDGISGGHAGKLGDHRCRWRRAGRNIGRCRRRGHGGERPGAEYERWRTGAGESGPVSDEQSAVRDVESAAVQPAVQRRQDESLHEHVHV